VVRLGEWSVEVKVDKRGKKRYKYKKDTILYKKECFYGKKSG
jgi:hypothetical protein